MQTPESEARQKEADGDDWQGDVAAKGPARTALLVLGLTLMPLLVLWLSAELAEARGEYWLGKNFDPAYVYLNCGFQICRRLEPVFIDHPGTPLQFLCAAVVSVKGGGSPVDLAVDPERYLAVISSLLALLIAGATFSAGWKARSHGVAIAVLVQALPFALFMTLKELGKVSPEPLLLALAVLISGFLLAPSKDESREKKQAWLLGLLSGTAIAVKVTAIPLAVGLCCIWRARRNLLSYLGFCTLALVFWVLPIYKRAGVAYHWFLKLGTHGGLYGSGAPGVIPAGYLSSLGKVVGEHTCLLLAALLSLVLGLVFRSDKTIRGTYLALAVIGLLQFLLVARHPYDLRYTLPAVVCLVSLPLGLVELKKRNSTIALLVTLGLLVGAAMEMSKQRSFLITFLARGAEQQRIVAREAEALRQDGAMVISAYRASDPALVLHIAGGYNRFPLRGEMAAAFPDRIIFHNWSSQFRRPWQWRELHVEDFWDGKRPLYLQQGNFEAPQLPGGLRLGPVHLGEPPGEALYRLEIDPPAERG